MSLFARLAENKESMKTPKRLTDAWMKKMIPLFVKAPPSDHKCGGCSMFVPGKNSCTIVEGVISADGTCIYQSGGPNSRASEIHETRMSKDNANYGELVAPVNCASCRFYDEPKTYCKLWEGMAEPADCCMAQDSPDYT